MRIGLVTFGDGGYLWKATSKRLTRNAKQSLIFNVVKSYTLNDLKEIGALKSNKDFFRSRGFGYWIWKPHTILEFAKVYNSLDVIVYADAGCHLNFNKVSLRRLNEYFDLCVKNSSVLVYESEHLESSWTKMDLLTLYPEQYWNTKQLLATVIIGQPKQLISVCEEWLRVAYKNEFSLLNDKQSVQKNSLNFIAHRHDQSILSLILKDSCKAIYISEKETFSPNWKTLNDFPIWSTRYLSSADFLNYSVLNEIRRKKDGAIFKIQNIYRKVKMFIVNLKTLINRKRKIIKY